MKTEAKKKFALNAVPEAALEEAGLAKETILAAIPMDGVVLLTKDSMPIVELLQMLDRLNLYAAEMLAAVATECGPCEKADEALTVEDVLEECEVTIPAWAREQAGIPENAKLACFVNEGEVIVGEAEACAPDLADVPQYVLKFFVDNHFNLRALDDMLNVWIRPVPCSCEVSGDAEYPDALAGNADFIRQTWVGGRTTDCVGLIKGYGWLDAETEEIVYNTNGMPDISANEMYGAVMLYGHVHNTREWSLVEKWKNEQWTMGIPSRLINVGCMMAYMNYTPRTLDELLEANPQPMIERIRKDGIPAETDAGENSNGEL